MLFPPPLAHPRTAPGCFCADARANTCPNLPLLPLQTPPRSSCLAARRAAPRLRRGAPLYVLHAIFCGYWQPGARPGQSAAAAPSCHGTMYLARPLSPWSLDNLKLVACCPLPKRPAPPLPCPMLLARHQQPCHAVAPQGIGVSAFLLPGAGEGRCRALSRWEGRRQQETQLARAVTACVPLAGAWLLRWHTNMPATTGKRSVINSGGLGRRGACGGAANCCQPTVNLIGATSRRLGGPPPSSRDQPLCGSTTYRTRFTRPFYPIHTTLLATLWSTLRACQPALPVLCVPACSACNSLLKPGASRSLFSNTGAAETRGLTHPPVPEMTSRKLLMLVSSHGPAPQPPLL